MSFFGFLFMVYPVYFSSTLEYKLYIRKQKAEQFNQLQSRTKGLGKILTKYAINCEFSVT